MEGGNIKQINLPNEDLDLRGLLWLIFIIFLWGGGFVATKVALDDMPPFLLAGVRFAISSLIVAICGILTKEKLMPQRNEVFPLLIVAVLFSAQICTFNLGMKYTLAGRSSILMSMNPIFVTVLAHFFIPNDRLNIKKIIGLALAFFGMLVVFRDKINVSQTRVIGDIVMIISAFLVSTMTIITKRIVQNINTYKLLFWEMLIGLIPFFGLSFIFEDFSWDNININLIISTLYMALIISGFTFILWTLLLKRYSASKLSVFIFIMPIFGIGLSAIMLHDPITAYLVIGTILIAAGIYIVNKG